MSGKRVQLCTYSRSDVLARHVLPSCPIELNQAEHEHCPCRRRDGVDGLRVLTCSWPRLWNGREIVNPPAFAEATRQSCALKVRLEAAANAQAAAKKETTVPEMNAPGRPVQVASPPAPAEIPDAEVVPTTAVVPVAQTQAPPPAEQPTKVPVRPYRSLAAALAVAQQKCRAVQKDARNAHHGYRYASAEAVIQEAKQALADTGLALVPSEQALNRLEGGGFELFRRFLLIHESGESLSLCCAWPVVEERGRPLDKATAISATASLSYILRDLLMMPRVAAEADLAGQRAPAPPAASARSAREQAQQAAPAQATGKATEEQLTRLRELRNALFELQPPGDPAAAWAAILAKRGVQTAKELPREQADDLIGKLRHQVQCADLEAAAKKTA